MSFSNIKVLLLNVNREGWHSGNMIYDMLAVQRGCDTKVYGPGWDRYDTTDMQEIIEKLYGDGKPDFIYSYFTPNERVNDVYMNHYKIPEHLRHFPTNFQNVKGIKKIFALSDFWARKPHQYSLSLKNSSFEYCFCCFTPPYSKSSDFYSFFDSNLQRDIKFIAYPRCIDMSCFKDYGLIKKHDVITVGAMWRFYKFRMWMHNFMKQNALSMGIDYKHYNHCGVNFQHNEFVRDKYAKAINQSKILISCGGRYHLAYSKIFEAMSCRTLYIGEVPYGEKELHMKDGENYIAVTKDDFSEKVQYYLHNKNERDRIANNGLEMFQKYHHIDARARDFVKLLEEIS